MSPRPPKPASHVTLKIGGAEPIGQFREISGFDSEQDVVEQKEVDANGRPVIVRVPAGRRSGLITLRREVDSDTGLWEWWREVETQGPDAARKDCTIELLDQSGTTVATFSLINAWPSKYTGAALSLGPDSNETAVEEITLAHEGFRRE
jgi:phage tail-like protein